jgi:hypothetical protein
MQQRDHTRLRRFWRRHRGERALLLCNGPSLRQVQFSQINRASFTVFGLNKIFLGFDLLGWEPDYLVAVNDKVLKQSLQMFQTLRMPKFVSNRLPLSDLPEDPLTFHLRTTGLPPGAGRFSTDIVQYVREGWTVTHAALQVIHYMGFAEAFIVGMDHRFSQHTPGRENTEGIVSGDDVDHFHPQYFGGGQTWDYPDLRNSEISYKAARDVFEAGGRSIIDCTIGGACDVFEKADVSVLYSS